MRGRVYRSSSVYSRPRRISRAFSPRSLRVAKARLLFFAAAIPVIGIPGIIVGLFMRISALGIDPAGALPLFVLKYMPSVLAGAILATLFPA